MPKVNTYVDISEVEKEAKKDFIDRHSPFVHVEGEAVKGQKLKVKVKVGNEYSHPDDFDHYIAYVQLWDGDTLLGQATFTPGTLGNERGQVEVDFYIVPKSNKLKLNAMSYCTKHGLWQSEYVEVEVKEPVSA
ncbi:MAG TPA: dethiobiotin synthase [Persephonella sp.]|uniref:Desulfoferrodoxin, ferrous iron-binding region n=1 Tax=Persephonella marina (strain DSM 14350 / EX-H1) TaxID=123214 RepID=C0QSM1_PERMH|nr:MULTISPECIES: class II SORL domain-containing protein [Persephonella]ACO04911.1 desulfoferrodoxin, ferrous iron-binding region [Persephonella marina EX-H1]HCB69414.1 dethiobiotin synthase [Persephonella sp.]